MKYIVYCVIQKTMKYIVCNIVHKSVSVISHIIIINCNLIGTETVFETRKQRRSNIRTGSAAHFCIIGFLVIFLCIVAPPAAPRFGRVKFVFFYRTSYVGLTSCQHLATVIRYADCVKQHFRPSRRHQVDNFTSFISRLSRLLERILNLNFSEIVEIEIFQYLIRVFFEICIL